MYVHVLFLPWNNVYIVTVASYIEPYIYVLIIER